jgi:hypothetical protein
MLCSTWSNEQKLISHVYISKKINSSLFYIFTNERPEKATRGEWMRVNQISSMERGLYLKIDPMSLSSNSAKTAQL